MKHVHSITLLFVLLTLQSFSQDLNAPIPLDKDVRTGKLSNGLTYYIRKNSKPEKKVDLRLVINAGSILEQDDQQGLAHFMEHMCFNGTKRFPKNQLVDYLQSIGVKFGQHLNAYTSFDETVYFLPIPSDSPEKIEKGFQIIEDWAFNANLTPEEIDKERGVVLEEYRLGLGADKRMEDRYIPKMMYNSQYAVRLPIGKKEILENFTYDKLISFYKDWYRPNLMCVIVVGDIDVDSMEQKIKEHFSAYKNPKNEKARKVFDVPNHKQTLIAIESDKEATNSQVQLYYKDSGSPKQVITIADYKENLIEYLFSTMLNNRLEELTNSTNPPFTYGYTYHGGTFARSKEAFQSFAMPQDGKQLDALKILIMENERAKKYGFTIGEFERAKAEILRRKESMLKEKDKRESEDYVWQYQGNFLEKAPYTDIDWSYTMTKKLLPNISLDEVNKFISKFIKEENRVVVLTSPEKENQTKITENDVIDVLNFDYSTVTPYEDTASISKLLRKDPVEGKVISISENSTLGTKTLELSNGAKVTYKKTDFKNDEILFEAVSLGGTNLVSDTDYKKIQFAIDGISEAGYAGLTLNEINKFLIGKIVNVNLYVQPFMEGMSGSTTPGDLEYLMQIIHAQFTDLNYDEKAFNAYKLKQSAFLENLSSQPSIYFQQEFYRILNKNNPRFNGLFPTSKEWSYTDYQLAFQKIKERFSNAADFEFYFVGAIDELKLIEFATKYLASLPSSTTKERIMDTGYRFIKGNLKEEIRKGKDPKSTVQILFYGETKYTPKEALSMRALGEVLTIKLVEKLREQESGVYGVGARGNVSKVPYESYNFSVSFPCGPENVEKLIASTMDEIKKVIENGPEEKDLNKFKEAEFLEIRKKLKENEYWIRSFIKTYINGFSENDILSMEKSIQALTVKDLQVVAQKYLTKDKAIGILLPE